jgi:hypothetical protein
MLNKSFDSRSFCINNSHCSVELSAPCWLITGFCQPILSSVGTHCTLAASLPLFSGGLSGFTTHTDSHTAQLASYTVSCCHLVRTTSTVTSEWGGGLSVYWPVTIAATAAPMVLCHHGPRYGQRVLPHLTESIILNILPTLANPKE